MIINQKRIALVIYYHKSNRYSFNAIIGALETSDIFDDLDIFFVRDEETLIKKLSDVVSKYEKVVACFSFFTTQLWDIKDLIANLRQKFNDSIVFIAGGPHPTGDPKGSLNLGFDVVVVGEGEETFIELLKKIKGGSVIANIKGIAYVDEEMGYYYTGKRTPIDLNEYPPFPIKKSKFGAIEITRGCPYACYFCQTPYISGIRPRHRSVEIICECVRIMKEKNLTDIRFITPNAFSYGSEDGKTLNLPALEDLLVKIRKIIGKRGRIFLGSFPSEVRPEHVTKDTLDLILRHASNDNIIIGAQSGSQRILDLCHRVHTVEDVYNAVELTLNVKLKANVDFIFGLPGENDEDIALTIKLLRDLVKMGARIHAHSFIPLPQTPFANESVKRISESVQREIKNLTSRGAAFGDWKKQEELAIKIAKYLKTNKIK